jgi:acetyltransferase-like isoleucine patch superfamily enzyme
VTIGDEALIEESGISDTHFHSIKRDRNCVQETRGSSEVLIGRKVSIGARSIIQKGVRIGDDAVICPGSVVVRSLPPGSVSHGNPASPIREGSTPAS